MRARTAAEAEGAAENLVNCAVNAASRFARFLRRESLFRLTGRSLVGKLGLTKKCSCTTRCRVTPERKARAFLFSGAVAPDLAGRRAAPGPQRTPPGAGCSFRVRHRGRPCRGGVSERFLGAGRALRPPTLARRGWGTQARYTP